MKRLPIDYISSRNKNYFLFKQDIGLTSSIREGKIWEQHLYDSIKDINFENTTIIDIGANLGVHSLEFADLVGENGKVYAFEPQRIVYYQLCANIIANGYDNIYAHNVALSDKNGTTFIEKQDFYLDGLLNIGDTHVGTTGDEVEEIKLDNYNLNDVSLIKIDVQGYETFVLDGSIETIKRNKPIILIEVEDSQLKLFNKTSNDIIDFFNSISYNMCKIGDIDYIATPKTYIEHFYQNIDGWFDFEDVYSEMVNRFNNALFVELGAAWGKSSSYMAVEIANSRKNIKFDVIDKWEADNDSSLKKYLDNIELVRNYINPIKGYTTDIVNNYEDNSIDFLFVDASHTYEDVLKDIQLWHPKVKNGGVVAGHDYNRGDFPGVVQAVNEYFGENNVRISKWSWIVEKTKIDPNAKILVMSCCFNEEKILPFYLDYYTNFIGVDKIVIYDGGSTDNSQNIIKECDKADLIIDVQNKLDDRYLNDMRNNGWKSYKDKYDWIIVCDIDEFIYHPNLKNKLLEYVKEGITIPLTDGYDMISKEFPIFEKGKYIHNLVRRGILDNVFLNKKSIFKSSININYHIGSHGCDPTGPVKYSDTIEIKHLHYKWLSHSYLTRRSAGVADRLSDWNLEGGCGSHNRPYSLIDINKFNKRYDQSVQVIEEIEEIESNEKLLYAFSHNYLINNWNEIFVNQLILIKSSGLYNNITTIFMYVYGDDENYTKFTDKIKLYDTLHKISVTRIDNNFYEYPTIQSLHDFIKTQKAYILYFHLKGVWSINNGGNPEAIKSWRECMEYFNIEKWEDCVKKLDDGYDVVGALYNYNGKEPLFSGNFWWATSDYIKKLPKLEYIKDNDPYPDDITKTWCRVECEKWINRIPNKFYNFYTPKDYGFYFAPLKSDDYKNKIDHIYQNIDGWFDFQEIYSEMVNKFPDGSHFVELGAWVGKSTSYMAVEIANSLKKIKFDTIDTWKGSQSENEHKEYIDKLDKSLYDKFLDNVSPVLKYINPIKGYSHDVVKNYDDESLDFIFLDASHDYNDVKRDIELWYPKVKIGGIIGGHDYEDVWMGVKKAVNEYFGENNLEIKEGTTKCWYNIKVFNSTKISLVCIAKDEDYYLEEWLKYNHKLGFDHIFLYENNWKCDIDLPYLTKIEWNGETQQLLAYNNFIETYKNEYDYAAFFDCDEFLVLKKHENIHDFIKEYGRKNIAINWQIYGSGGKINRENNSLLKQFTKRQNGVNDHIKSILYLKNHQRMELPHNPDIPIYDTNGKMIIGAFNPNGPVDVVVINHYMDKTKRDYENKIHRGYADATWRDIKIESWEERKNTNIEVEDLMAYNFIYKKHIYENIDGWFDFQEIYSEMVNKFPNGSHFVEVGAWLGKSTSYMAVEIANSLKKIKFDAIDTWEGSKNFTDDNFYKTEKDPFDIFKENVKPVENFINPIRGLSENIFEQYPDESLDFVFIDAGHDYKSVITDIKNWYPKVKKNGVIAGHDYIGYTDVKKAVDEFFGENNIRLHVVHDGTWIVDKSNFDKKFKNKISIIIPTYNRNNYLKDCLDSVLNQNYDNMEILVCHDGPSSSFNDFIKSYSEKRDKRIKSYSTPSQNNDLGASQRNFCLNLITGNYILFLDDDNVLYPNYLKKMMEHKDDDTGMIVCRIHFNDKEWYNYVLPIEDKLQPCFIDHLSILFRFDIAKQVSWDNNWGQDHRYINNCEKIVNDNGLKIKYIPDILANHRFLGNIIPRIAIIHHCYLRYNWKEILEEQIFLIKRSGLYDECTEIFATIYADDKNNIQEFKHIISSEDILNKWKIIELEQNNYEYDALKYLKKYSEDKHAYICYFHLKGVISEEIKPNIGIQTWRKYLNYFTINKWKENIDKLKNHDVVCVDWNFNDMHQRYVLGGHFFWTKSVYIRTLNEPEINENRFLSEIWITSNNDVEVYENFNYEKIGYKNLYLQVFPPSLYRDENEYLKETLEFSNNTTKKSLPIELENVVYIITSHPNFKMSEDITKRTIQNIKSFGEKVILSAHCPVSEELQLMSDYFIYDRNNPLIKHDFFTQSWFTKEDYYAFLNITKNDNNTNHALGVFLNYYNSLILAKSQGFDIAVCTNFDMVFSEKDKKLIDERIYQMKRIGKKAFFMNTPETEGIHYKTIFFITNINYFLDNFKYITNEQTYNDEMKKVGSNTNCLENFFYHSLKNKTDDLLLEEIDENNLFSTSKINLFSLIEYFTILSVENEPDNFMIWFSSANSLDDRELSIASVKNGNVIFEDIKKIDKEFVYYKKMTFHRGDKFIIGARTISNGDVVSTKIIEVNDDIFNDIKSYGYFIDKKKY